MIILVFKIIQFSWSFHQKLLYLVLPTELFSLQHTLEHVLPEMAADTLGQEIKQANTNKPVKVSRLKSV